MKKVALAIVAQIIFAFTVIGQTPCPTLSIDGPKGLTRAGEPFTFTAIIDKEVGNYKIEYIWKVSGGKIVSGKGTSILKLLMDEMCSVEAELKVKGLPEDCPNSVFAAAEISDCGYRRFIKKIDEFSSNTIQIDNARFEYLASVLKNELSSKAYIAERFNRGTSAKIVKRKLDNSFVFLTKNLGIPPDKITWQISYGEGNFTEFWIVPPSVNPPEIMKGTVEI